MLPHRGFKTVQINRIKASSFSRHARPLFFYRIPFQGLMKWSYQKHYLSFLILLYFLCSVSLSDLSTSHASREDPSNSRGVHFTGDEQWKILIADTSLGGNHISECRNNNNKKIIATWSWTRELFSLMIQMKNLRKKFREKASKRSHVRSTKYLVWPEGNRFMMSQSFN